MSGIASKRGWTVQQDQIIVQMISEWPEDKHRWVDVSKEIYLKTGRDRTGKQCRERWQHQLDPSITRQEWTEAEIHILFEKQAELGNKWAQIAVFLPGRTDNAVKNFFYSSVRRVLAKINLYMAKQRTRKEFKAIRQFQSDYMSKLMAVVDGNYQKRLRLTDSGSIKLAKNILLQIVNLVAHGVNENIEGINDELESKIEMMHEFRKSCKKRKLNHNFNNLALQQFSCSDEKDSALISSSSSSEKSKGTLNQAKFSLNQGEKIQLQSQKGQKITQSQNSFEQDFLKQAQLSQLQIKKIDSFCFQIPLNKSFSGIEENNEKVWNFFSEDYHYRQDYFKMQQQRFEQKYEEECDIFSMPYGYREDYLGSSQIYGQAQGVTKFKMLEASLTLDQCLLKAKQSSCFENIRNPEGDF